MATRMDKVMKKIGLKEGEEVHPKRVKITEILAKEEEVVTTERDERAPVSTQLVSR